jgi:hypothetical protein
VNQRASRATGDVVELTRQLTRRAPNGGGGLGARSQQTAAELPAACARCEAGAVGCECANEGRGGRADARRLEKGRVGTGAASACVVGAESTATRRLCTGGSEGKGLTDGTHRSARANKGTSDQAGKRDPQDSERSYVSEGEVGANKSAPPGSGREREESARVGWRR